MFIPIEVCHGLVHIQTSCAMYPDIYRVELGMSDSLTWKPTEGMGQALFKVFENFGLGEKVMLCLWHN